MFNNYIPLKFLGARGIRRLLAFLLLTLTFVSPALALTATVDIGGVKYFADYDTETAVALGLADGVKVINNLEIPASVEVGFLNGSVKRKCAVVEVAQAAFNDGKLTGTLKLGWQIEKIGMLAFANNPDLTGGLELPQELKSIGEAAFRSNLNMKGSLKFFPWGNLELIGPEAFGNCGFTGTLEIPGSVKYIYPSAFHNCKGFTGTLNIPENVQYIGESAFSGCSGFTGLSLGKSLQSVRDSAFAGCSGIKGELTFPDGFWDLGSDAFSGCSSLSGTLTIPQISAIPNGAFQNCSSITALVIPSSVGTIGSDAFAGCNGLKSVSCDATTPPVDGEGKNSSFNVTIKQNAQLNVKSTSKKLYQTAFDWKDFKKIVGDNDPTSVSLDKTSATLNVGATVQLKATIAPSGAYNETLTWATSDASVATVDANGKVSAVSRGTANITVTTDNGKTATCTVTVNQPVTSVSVDLAASGFSGGKAEMRVSESKTLKVTINPANANDLSLTYTSSNAGVVSVDNNGVIKANALGSATITVTASSGVKTTLTVTVVPTPASNITLNKTEASLKATETLQLTAEVLPVTTTDKTVTWTSSDNDIATVDNDGLVTAVAVGFVNITATCGTVSGTCVVTVVPTPAESVALDITEATLNVPETLQLTATILPATTTDKTLTWTSSNETVATVDATGKVTAVKAGEATITVTTTSGRSATLKVTVLQPALGIAIDFAASGIEGETLVINY